MVRTGTGAVGESWLPMIAPQTSPAEPASNILGISAKSLHAGRRAKQGADPEAAVKAKSRRFEMQRKAQSLLYAGDKSANEQYRVCWCCRTINTHGETVRVYRQVESGGARFAGLTTCGSVWHCPVCAAKITEGRRRELDKALTAWVGQGGKVQLMTLTFPHEAGQGLDALLERFGKAVTAFKNSRTYKRIMGAADRAGSIRSLEATWGENGWHPHTHDLVFLGRDLTMTDVDELKAEWVKRLFKLGLGDRSKLSDMLAHGLDIQDGKYAAEYIAKFGHDAAWGAAAELTKPHGKAGRVGEFGGADHYSPFQLLAWAEQGDTKAGALFREFGESFEGKRMLSWSPKLRAKLDLLEAEMTDEQIAAHEDVSPEETFVGELDQDQFKILIARNRQGDFLGYVAQCCANPETGQADIDDYIRAIATTKQTHGTQYRLRNFMGGGFSTLH